MFHPTPIIQTGKPEPSLAWDTQEFLLPEIWRIATFFNL